MEPLSQRREPFLSVVEPTLKDIVDPFLRTFAAKYSGLTPKEITVANLVKEGTPTREIAQLMTYQKGQWKATGKAKNLFGFVLVCH